MDGHSPYKDATWTQDAFDAPNDMNRIFFGSESILDGKLTTFACDRTSRAS